MSSILGKGKQKVCLPNLARCNPIFMVNYYENIAFSTKFACNFLTKGLQQYV